jgi:hypothetical protein
MRIDEFQNEFGAWAPWSFKSEHDDVVLAVNKHRSTLHDVPPLMDGIISNWGWTGANVQPGELERDWSNRAEALRIALQLFRTADEAGLVRSSEADVPYVPIVVKLTRSSDFFDSFKNSFGMPSSELPEVASVDPSWADQGLNQAELLPYDLFFGQDALLEGVEAYFNPEQIQAYIAIVRDMATMLRDPCHIRFDIGETVTDGRYVVSPEFWIGMTSAGYATGICSYEVRT